VRSFGKLLPELPAHGVYGSSRKAPDSTRPLLKDLTHPERQKTASKAADELAALVANRLTSSRALKLRRASRLNHTDGGETEHERLVDGVRSTELSSSPSADGGKEAVRFDGLCDPRDARHPPVLRVARRTNRILRSAQILGRLSDITAGELCPVKSSPRLNRGTLRVVRPGPD